MRKGYFVLLYEELLNGCTWTRINFSIQTIIGIFDPSFLFSSLLASSSASTLHGVCTIFGVIGPGLLDSAEVWLSSVFLNHFAATFRSVSAVTIVGAGLLPREIAATTFTLKFYAIDEIAK